VILPWCPFFQGDLVDHERLRFNVWFFRGFPSFGSGLVDHERLRFSVWFFCGVPSFRVSWWIMKGVHCVVLPWLDQYFCVLFSAPVILIGFLVVSQPSLE